MEERRVYNPAAGARSRDVRAVFHDQFANPTATGSPDAGVGGQVFRRLGCGAETAVGCERHAVSVGIVGGLQSFAESGEDPRDALRSKFRGRRSESPGTGNSGPGDQTGAERALHFDPGIGSNARAWDAFDAGGLGAVSGGTAGSFGNAVGP